MAHPVRLSWLLLLLLIPFGCSDAINPPGAVTIKPTPSELLKPQAPAPAEAKKDEKKPGEASQPQAKSEAKTKAEAPPAETASTITLEKMTFDQFLAKVATNPKAKLTVVDVWATWCGPCKENFTHLVEMHKEYADKGLAAASVSLDARDNAEVQAEALKFLQAKRAAFPNVLLDAEEGAGFDAFDINGIPAVFLYGPDGKEIRRFTMDDPDHQFTYDQVDQVVGMLLEGKPLPADAPGQVHAPRAKEEAKAEQK